MKSDMPLLRIVSIGVSVVLGLVLPAIAQSERFPTDSELVALERTLREELGVRLFSEAEVAASPRAAQAGGYVSNDDSGDRCGIEHSQGV